MFMNKSKVSKIMIFLLIFTLFFPFGMSASKKSFAVKNDEVNITSKSALLMDYNSETIIYEKNSNEKLPIASMTKLASLSIILDYISKGIIKENDLVTVSEFAASVGGSSAFLDAGSKYKVGDLIKTVVIASANDSTVALAEFVAGSEEGFVLKMNKLASSLGLKNTNFVNSTGLPADNHYSTASDMVKIYKTVCRNEIYRKYAKIWMDDFVHPSGRKTELVNTNRLVKTFDGIEGGKTGYTDKAKFCLTASATRGNTRLVGVVIGANDSKTRFAEMSKLFNYGFANFESKVLVNSEVPVTVAKFKNAKNQITLYPEKDINKFISKNEEFIFSTDFQIDEMKAPIEKGAVVGKLFVFDKNNMVIDEVNVIAGESAKEVGFKESFSKIISKW